MNMGKLWPAVLLPLALLTAALSQGTNRPRPAQMMMGHGMGHGMMGHGMMMGSMVRHRHAMMYGIPEPYRNARNPLPASKATLRRGAEVYAQNCASCHGAKGYGDGPAGQRLSPRPANLAWLARSHMAHDQYVYWTVEEGGKPVGSAMPPFKGALLERDIWAVVTYVRQGLGERRY